jgi:major membrane immunogen (membrane-anchored lipoprotein)
MKLITFILGCALIVSLFSQLSNLKWRSVLKAEEQVSEYILFSVSGKDSEVKQTKSQIIPSELKGTYAIKHGDFDLLTGWFDFFVTYEDGREFVCEYNIKEKTISFRKKHN